MSEDLSEGQNFALGIIAAFIEGVILQPTYYWKNAAVQHLPFTLNPKLLYRGTACSIMNECQAMGIQFGGTSWFQKIIGTSPLKVTRQQEEFAASSLGGLTAATIASPVELIMIQQQKFGLNLSTTSFKIISQYGVLRNGIMRGLYATAWRDSIYCYGMLGVTPVLQDYLIEKHNLSMTSASLYASVLGGVVAALPSQPFDVIKTCMQGDLPQNKYRSFRETFKQLYIEGGCRRLFHGCFWRTVNIVATVYIANECKNHLSVHFQKMSI